MEEFFGVGELARILKVSIWTVYRLAASGVLPSLRIGSRRLFMASDVAAFVAAQRAGKSPEAVSPSPHQ